MTNRYLLQRTASRTGSYLVVSFAALVILVPFFWMLSTSFKTLIESMRVPPTWIPETFVPGNYIAAWNVAPFGRYFFNSFFIATMSTAGEVLTSIFAAYAFAKMEFFGKRALFIALLATMMIPGHMLLIPNFITINRFDWYDKYQALIIPWIVGVFSIFLLRQFFKTLPDELWDSAQLDGCSRFRFIWRIVVPLSKPAITTVSLYAFVNSWNAFLWVMIMTDSVRMRTIPVGLRYFQEAEGANWPLLMAASTMAIAPVVLLFLFAQKQFIRGIARTGFK